MEGNIQLSKAQICLELNAQTTPERAERRHQYGAAILRIQGDVALCKHIVAIRASLPPAGAELGEGLSYTDVEVRIHLVERVAEGIHARHRRPTHPLIADIHVCACSAKLGIHIDADGAMH